MKVKEVLRKLEALALQYGEDAEVDIHFYVKKRGEGYVPIEEPLENVTVLGGRVILEN